jgi:D-alanyl-D-alanine endopeptidase (penicillin-binding protein 7)
MSDGQKFFLYVTGVLVFLFSIFKANMGWMADVERVVQVRLDQPTIERGYTMTSGDQLFSIPITAQSVTAPAVVKIEKPEVPTGLPENLQANADHYVYDIKTLQKGFLPKPVKLIFSVNSDIDTRSLVYYYDKSKVQWRSIPTVVDVDRQRVIAMTPFPYAEVVVAGPVVKKAEIVVEPATVVDDQFTAHGAIAVDEEGNIFYEKNIDKVWPLASLTKLMSAYVFLQHNPGWETKVKIIKSDIVGGASVYYQADDIVKVKDLFYSMLVGSKNDSTMALMRSTGMTAKAFVAEMNQTAKNWGLLNTKFFEPTGLDARNVSTAREFIEVARRVYEYPELTKAMQYESYDFKYERKGANWLVRVKNTNLTMLQKDIVVLGSKTGWTEEADHNLVTKAKKKATDEHSYIALVLGSRVWKNYEEVYTMLEKGFDMNKTVAQR